MPKMKVGFSNSLLLSCVVFLLSTPTFGGCNNCQNVSLSLLRSINQKTININRNLANSDCLGTVLLTSPTTITKEGKYTLCNDMVGPIIIATDNVFLDLNNFVIKTPTSGSTQVGAIIIQAGYSNIEIHGGRIQGPIEHVTKKKSQGSENDFVGIIIKEGTGHISLIELGFVHLDKGIFYQGTEDHPISYPVCVDCSFYNCLQSIEAFWVEDAICNKLFIQHGYAGILLDNCSGCLITESQLSGMYLNTESPTTGVGIYMLKGGDNEISANNIRDCQNRGIWSLETIGLAIKANDITRIGERARIPVSEANEIWDAIGIQLGETDSGLIQANSISNITAKELAIGLQDKGSNSIVIDNLFFNVELSGTGSAAGIVADFSGSYDSNFFKKIEGEVVAFREENTNTRQPYVINNKADECSMGYSDQIRNVSHDILSQVPLSNSSINQTFPYLNTDPISSTFYGPSISSIAWSKPFGYHVAIGGSNGVRTSSLRVYSFDGSNLHFVARKPYGWKINTLSWSPTSTTLQYLAVGGKKEFLSGTSNVNIYSFDGATFTFLPGANVPYGREIKSIDWSPKGNYLAVGGEQLGSYNIQLYSFDGTTLTLIPGAVVSYEGVINSLKWSPNTDKLYLAVGGFTKNIRVYSFDGSHLTLLPNANKSYGGIINSLDWSPTGEHLVVGGKESGGRTSSAKLYSFSNDTLTYITSKGYGAEINAVSWSPSLSNNYISVGGTQTLFITAPSKIQVYTFNNNELTLIPAGTSEYGDRIHAANWAPLLGNYLAIGGDEKISSSEAKIHSFTR